MTTEQLITKAEKWLRNETGNNCSNLSLKQAAKAMVYFHQHLLQQTQCTTPFVCGHPPNQTYLVDGVYHCQKCNGIWESLAAK